MLTIKDLTDSKEIDMSAMSAVKGALSPPPRAMPH